RVLVPLRTIVFLQGIFVLSLDETTTNLNGVQFVCADAAVQYFLAADLCIKKPLSFLLHERNRKRKIIVAYQNNGLIRIFFVCVDRHFFFCLGCKFRSTIFVLNRVFGGDNVLAVWTKNRRQRCGIKGLSRLS